uniref:non-specific serine/threonine protein kinase n=1 Tax=Arcella intermedia TaxID=1963864 RepID=A0A6B2LCT6_9EUKA
MNGYLIGETVGSGSAGKVKLCKNLRNGQQFAMKIWNRNDCGSLFKSKKMPTMMDVQREINLMKKLNHPNIVKLHQVIDEMNHKNLYIVMEYVPGGCIMDSKFRSKLVLSESLVKPYFVGLVKAVKYLHSLHIVHRDIKPENILFRPGSTEIKLCDFSSAEVLTAELRLTGSAGTASFTAPELCKEYVGVGSGPLAFPTDIWSSGVTLYCLVLRSYPFNGKNVGALYHNILSSEVSFSPADDLSIQFQDLIKRMLSKNPSQRISIPEIQKHPWFASLGRAVW